nr:phospholipid carrier-dependent glycosyltransferase [Desulfobacterales bacterium]
MLRLRTYAYYALLFVLLFHILIVCLLCDTPPISRDALIHHLAIPKLWLNHGGFYEIPWAEYSYYPMNIEVLYLVSLYFKNDIAPKFIHFVFGLGTGLLVFCYLKQRFDRIWGLLGMIIFITTPIVVWLSTSAYVDLGMTFFTTGSILSFTKWRGSGYGRLKWLIISSSFMGMALGTKYNALIVWFFLNLMIAYYYAKDTRRQLPALKYGFVFFTITLLIASPWYIKNYLLTGNPFYPLFESFFRVLHKGGGGGDGFGAIVQTLEIDFFQRRRMMYGESFWMTILIPVRMFFQGENTRGKGRQYPRFPAAGASRYPRTCFLHL